MYHQQKIYFFHTDHLGSTSYLTDTAGSVCQFVCYTPYGEAFVDEHSTTYENPFKFSGKELDDVTGLYDHGARSRNPISTLWLGVDPVFHPASSPYAYCLGNPVRLIDPNGMEEEENNVSLGDKVVKTIKKIDKGGTSDPSNSGSDESIKSLKDKVVKFFKEVVESVEKSAVGSDKSGTPPAEGGKGTQGYGNGKDPNNAATEKGKSQGNAIDHSDDGQGALEKYYHPEGYTGNATIYQEEPEYKTIEFRRYTTAGNRRDVDSKSYYEKGDSIEYYIVRQIIEVPKRGRTGGHIVKSDTSEIFTLKPRKKDK